MAAGAYALWLNDTGSSLAAGAYAYLENELDNGTSWFWTGPYRESDVAGIALLSIAASQHLGTVQSQSDVSSRLLHLQRVNGGFEGLENVAGQVLTSSVDTAMALWGLSYAQIIPLENRTAAVNYLLSLQNLDGSFNLTSTEIAEHLYSLGPDPVSITAATILALRENGFGPTNETITKAMGFLTKQASTGFGGSGHVYGASLSTLAFLQYYRPQEAGVSLAYLLSQQNSDGGFGDVTRFTSGSNALDTGWASVALQFGNMDGVLAEGSVNQPPTARFSYDPAHPTNGSIVSFDAGSSSDSDGDLLLYNWTFGDGGSASGQRVTHSYVESGIYTATLIVTDSGANPDRLTGTTWHGVTVLSSQTPARTAAAEPSALTGNLELVLAVLLTVVVAGYLVIRINKNRRAKK